MAEILINAEEVRSCVKYKSGKVCIWLDGVKEIREVPTHGDLIDRSLALGACHEMARSIDMEGAFEVIENAPTVLEASEERKKSEEQGQKRRT